MVNVLAITFPLYIYPSGCYPTPYSNNCAWYPFFQSVTANPGVVFNFIVNVNSGPYYTSYPNDTNWSSAIDWVNKRNNTRTLGYIDSNPSSIPPSTYKPQLQSYVNWAKSNTGLQLGMKGVFVDDVAFSSSTTNYYSTYVSNIKSAWSNGGLPAPYIMLNPGVPIDCSFYSKIDSAVTFEDYYYKLPNAPFTQSQWSACPRYKQTILIHDFNGTAVDQQQVCDDMGETQRVGSLFITSAIQNDQQNINPYDSVPPLLSQFAGSVKATNSWITAHPQWYPDI